MTVRIVPSSQPLNRPEYAAARSASVEKPRSCSSLAANRSGWPASMIRSRVVPGARRAQDEDRRRVPLAVASATRPTPVGIAERNRAMSASETVGASWAPVPTGPTAEVVDSEQASHRRRVLGLEERGVLSDRRRAEERDDEDRLLEVRLHLVDEAGGLQRRPAQLEEPVVDADLIEVQDLLPLARR